MQSYCLNIKAKELNESHIPRFSVLKGDRSIYTVETLGNQISFYNNERYRLLETENILSDSFTYCRVIKINSICTPIHKVGDMIKVFANEVVSINFQMEPKE